MHAAAVCVFFQVIDVRHRRRGQPQRWRGVHHHRHRHHHYHHQHHHYCHHRQNHFIPEQTRCPTTHPGVQPLRRIAPPPRRRPCRPVAFGAHWGESGTCVHQPRRRLQMAFQRKQRQTSPQTTLRSSLMTT